jgi:ATP:ADP antiporter, AAA family
VGGDWFIVVRAVDDKDRARVLGPSMVASASLVAQLVAGKATRDALFLSHFPVSLLPASMIAGAALSAVSVIGMTRALSRSGPARVVPAAFALSAILFLAEWSLSTESEKATAIAVYAHMAVFGSAIGSAFWSLVNERFDPHEAKRYIGRIASGGTVGGIVGGLLVWRASAHLSVARMLALLAAMSVVGLWGSLRMAPPGARQAKSETTESGLKVLGQTPYLRDLALLVAAGAVLQALLDWLLSAHARNTYASNEELLGFFALFNVVVGLLTFGVQTGITRRVLEARGLGGTVKLQPISVAAAVAFGLVSPVFYSAIAVRLVEAVTRNSLFRSAYELFYTPLPAAKKRAAKTIIDVGVDRIGTALGSGVLLVVARVAAEGDLRAQTRIVLFGVLAMTGAAWVISSRLQDGYVSALAESLRSGAVALDDIEDLTTRTTLAETTALLDRTKLLARIEDFQRTKARIDSGVEAPPPSVVPLPPAGDDAIVTRVTELRSRDPATMKRALGGPITAEIVPFAIPLLSNDAVVRDALRALRKAAPKTTGALVDALLDPEVDPSVRRRIPRVLKISKSPLAIRGLVEALSDPVFEVRRQVGLALEQMQGPFDREAILAAARHEIAEGRASWSMGGLPNDETDLERGLAHIFVVLGLVLDREPLSIAGRALRAEDASLRGTAFEYLEVALPPAIRDLLLPLLTSVKPHASSRPKRAPAELADELLRSRA